MRVYELTVDHVDGIMSVRCSTPEKHIASWFLTEMDHEGSSVHLLVVERAEGQERLVQEFDNAEVIYGELRSTELKA